jgi:hypothetical protein
VGRGRGIGGGQEAERRRGRQPIRQKERGGEREDGEQRVHPVERQRGIRGGEGGAAERAGRR